ncbi:MAG TPA: glycosyltransferase [Aquihabitans sp.]|nr:glycosyltransferase [Aquihabitans sp.]
MRVQEATGDVAPREAPTGPRVAYVVSRFPRLTETFVVDEAAAVRRAGARLELHPLHQERATVVQPAAEALAPVVHHHRLLERGVLASQVGALREAPAAYLGAAASVVRHNLGSRRLLVGAVAAFPLAVHLARRFRADGVEHVHAHFATHPAAVAYVVHRLTGIPFSFTAHGSDLHRDRHMLAEKVRHAAFVVAISEHNRQVVLDECGTEVADRVLVVRCGVDRSRFARRAARSRRPGDPLRVCCVGTLHEVKGQTHLVEAARRLTAAGVDVELTFVGDGPDREALGDQAAAAGLADRVRFTGPLVQPEVREVLEGADVLVAPSVPTADGRREGLPVVILEAMATGVPVVASRLSGIPEAVVDGRTGLLAAPGDVDGLVDAIGRLAADPTLGERLADGAADLVAREYDVDASAGRLVGLFGGRRP